MIPLGHGFPTLQQYLSNIELLQRFGLRVKWKSTSQKFFPSHDRVTTFKVACNESSRMTLHFARAPDKHDRPTIYFKTPQSSWNRFIEMPQNCHFFVCNLHSVYPYLSLCIFSLSLSLSLSISLSLSSGSLPSRHTLNPPSDIPSPR